MPEGRDKLVMLNGTAGEMLMLSAPLTVVGGEFESVTRTVKLEIPPPEGVPAIVPVLLFRLSPAGRVPAVMLHA